MPDIHIHRDHALGLAKARELAQRWAEKAKTKFEMECSTVEGDDCDTLEFMRSGVKGELQVTADAFDLHAKLGMMMSVFSKTIEAEIEKNLDALLARAGDPAAAARIAAAEGK
jgi:putative polyhydroxyalkanoate system protein